MHHDDAVADGDTVLDVGANFGFFTLALARKRRGLRVFCFEPLPATCEVKVHVCVCLCMRHFFRADTPTGARTCASQVLQLNVKAMMDHDEGKHGNRIFVQQVRRRP